jgi:hypothetical protein
MVKYTNFLMQYRYTTVASIFYQELRLTIQLPNFIIVTFYNVPVQAPSLNHKSRFVYLVPNSLPDVSLALP